jgi:hypothetical protein
MRKDQLVMIGGLATIMAAITSASEKRHWREAHTVAVIAGGVVTILGALADRRAVRDAAPERS